MFRVGGSDGGRRRGSARPRSGSARWGRAALRGRPGQAIGLLLLAALVAGCLALIPLATRALEHAVLKPPITSNPPAETSLSIDVEAADPAAGRAELDRRYAALGPQARRIYPHGIGQVRIPYGSTRLFAPPSARTEVGLVARDDICVHLTFSVGRCPSAPGEVAVSGTDAEAYGLAAGQTRDWAPGPADAPAAGGGKRLTVVGVYASIPDDRYWLGFRIGGNALAPPPGERVVLDDWVTAPATLAGYRVSASSRYAADAAAATLDDLPDAVGQVAQAKRSAGGQVRVTGGPEHVWAEGSASATQIRVLVPLVLGQLSALVVAVLYVVARAAVQARRREMGLARLRGFGARDVRRLLGAELLPPVLLGVPIGVAGAFTVTAGLCRWVLPAGTPLELRPGVVLATLLAWAVAAGAVHLALAQASRDGVAALLQRQRRLPTSAGPLTWVVAALAVAAVVVVLTSSDPTPLALATPTLLALALGLLVAAGVPRLAAPASQRALGRGRAALGLALAGVARRSSTRGVVVIVTVATCVAVVAVDAWSVGERNRTLRAELEAGADTAFVLPLTDPTRVEEAIRPLDPSGEAAAVVAVTRPRDRSRMSTLVAGADALAVAFPSALRDVDRAALAPPAVATVPVSGRTVTATLTSRLRLPAAPARGAAGSLVVVLTDRSGEVVERPLPLPAPGRTATLSAPLLCGDCRLDRLRLDLPPAGATGPVTGSVDLAALAVDGRDLRALEPAAWQASAGARPEGGVGLSITPTGESSPAEILRGDVPAPLPVVVAGELPAGQRDGVADAQGLRDDIIEVRPVQEVGQLPVLGARGILANRDVLGRRGARLGPDDRVEAWVAPGRPDLVAAIRSTLAREGAPVTAERSYADIKAGYDASGSAWGLTFALVAAVLSLLVAVGFLLVGLVLGRQAIAADAAALTLAGAQRSTVRRALARAGRRRRDGRRRRNRRRRPRVTAVPADAPAVHAPGRTPDPRPGARGGPGGRRRGRFGAAAPRGGDRGGDPRGRPGGCRPRAGGVVTGLTVLTRGLVHVYRSEGHDVAALAGVDLAIGAGETVCLLGPSGSGKSTLLALLAGLHRPSAGTIRIGPHLLSDVSDDQLAAVRAGEIGMVLQGGRGNLVPYLTGRDNVAFASSASGSAPEELLELVGAAEVADRLPRAMTPGQAQLVALAVAMAASPGLLLADEPTAALSHAARDQVLSAIAALNASLGVTVVAVAHDGVVARALGRTITIRDGRVGGHGRDGREYAVVAADGSLPLPAEALADLPPGTSVRVHRDERGWSILPVDPGEAP